MLGIFVPHEIGQPLVGGSLPEQMSMSQPQDEADAADTQPNRRKLGSEFREDMEPAEVSGKATNIGISLNQVTYPPSAGLFSHLLPIHANSSTQAWPCHEPEGAGGNSL